VVHPQAVVDASAETQAEPEAEAGGDRGRTSRAWRLV